MGASSDFERGQIGGAHLAGASVTKTATLFCVLRVKISKVMQHLGKTTSVKRNSGQKSTLTERGHHTFRRIV
jgi:hypothetical protein